MASSTVRKKQDHIPGTIYLNKNRYWWKVQLPGEDTPKARPLKPVGSQYATTDRLAAIECAKTILQNHLFQKEIPVQGEIRTISELVRAYGITLACLNVINRGFSTALLFLFTHFTANEFLRRTTPLKILS
jgi:hypothetical protein